MEEKTLTVNQPVEEGLPISVSYVSIGIGVISLTAILFTRKK